MSKCPLACACEIIISRSMNLGTHSHWFSRHVYSLASCSVLFFVRWLIRVFSVCDAVSQVCDDRPPCTICIRLVSFKFFNLRQKDLVLLRTGRLNSGELFEGALLLVHDFVDSLFPR